MAFEPLEFTKNWENTEDFPTYEPDERQVRADLQWLHNETREGLNRLVAALNDPGAAAQLPFLPREGLTAETVQDAILEVYAATREAASGLLVDGTVTKQKLAAELLERVYGGKVWVSLDTPGAAQNPGADFPVGQLWLRPGFAVENLAGSVWTVSGCGTQTVGGGWKLITDGTMDTVTAVQILDGVGKAGEKVWVRLKVTELDDHLSELALYLNDVEHDLMEGGGVFETELDQTGSLEILVWGAWPYAETGAVVRLSDLTVVDSDVVDSANGGCLPLSDWPGFLEAHAPFEQVAMPRTLYMQEKPGQWVAVSHTVLPADRGGTGLSALTKGQILDSNAANSLAALNPPGEANSVLTYNGTPQWKTASQLGDLLGQLKLMSGTYTGTAAARTVELPVTPKLLHIFPRGGVDTSGFSSSNSWTFGDGQPVVLADGAEAAQMRKQSYKTADGESYTGTWGAKIKLSGAALTFSEVGGTAAVCKADYMNRSGVTYCWTALY